MFQSNTIYLLMINIVENLFEVHASSIGHEFSMISFENIKIAYQSMFITSCRIKFLRQKMQKIDNFQKKNQYFKLFGKYTANSILNSSSIGINFSLSFVKLIYNYPVQFEDLLAILPLEERKNYENIRKPEAQKFQDLDLYFTAVVDKRNRIQHQLKPDGASIRVDKSNIG